MTIHDRIGHYLQSGRSWYSRSTSAIKVLTVHHDAIPHDNRQDETIMKSIMGIHSGKGWPGASYHYFIGRTGKIYQMNQDHWTTWHDGVNSDSIGIVLTGYFHAPHNNQPDARQLEALRDLIKYLKSKYPNVQVLGHRDRFSTACPGDNLYPKLKTINEDSMSDNSDLQKRIEHLEAEAKKDQERIESCRADRTAGETKIAQLEQQIKTLKEEFGVERESLKEEANQQKEVHKESLRWLAETLGTIQDFAKIRAEIVRCVEFEDLADKRGKEITQCNLQLSESKEDNQELRNLVDDLRRQAREAKGLGDATTAELITELVNKLVNIIRR